MSRIARLMPTVFGGNIIVFDDFNRADGALGNAVTGQAWTVVSGTWAILSNTARVSTSTNSHDIAIIDTDKSNIRAIMTLSTVNTDTSNEGGRLIIRYTDSRNYWAFGQAVFTPLRYAWFKRVNNVPVQTVIAGLTPSNGDVVAIIAVGNSIQFLVNGVVVGTTTDSFNATATICGIKGWSNTSARYDNFLVEAL